jgi:hypothetical protein
MRKNRINQRQTRLLVRQIRMIDNMSEEQKATIQRFVTAEVKGQVLLATDVAGWRELRTMGCVRETDGKLSLTAIGREVAND